MTINRRVGKLEQLQRPDHTPLMVVRTIVSPGPDAPVDRGLLLARTAIGTVYRNMDETEEAFMQRVGEPSAQAGLKNG